MLTSLIRGSRPATVVRRLPVAAASAGVGFLLLAVLGHALRHPGNPDGSLLRLGWCAVPLAAAVQLCVATARAEPGGRPLTGLDTLGAGPLRSAAAATAAVVLACLAGSAAAFGAFMGLRGAPAGAAPLPMGAVLTLLLVLPLAAAAACLVALRPRECPPGGEPLSRLPWALAMAAAGLALELYARTGSGPAGSPRAGLPAGLGRMPPALLVGWALTAAALVLAGPGLVLLGGRLLGVYRPGALRLLAGRALQEEARRIGLPLGVLSAVASAALAAAALHRSAARPPGVLSAVGGAVLVLCPAVSAAVAALEARHDRREVSRAVTRQGATAGMLRRAVALRAATAAVVLGAAALAVGRLAALPLAA